VKPAAFSYRRARSAEEAVALLVEAGEEARFIAGGQSLVPMMNFRIARPATLVDLNRCADLAFIRKEAGRLRIGAMTRQVDAEASALVRADCPMLAEALSHAGPLTVRNRATVGGSIANAYPLAQLPCVAVCLDWQMVLQGPNGVRNVPAAKFFVTAMVTAVKFGELLREVSVPCARASTRQAFREAGNHAGGAALAVVCVSAEMDGSSRIAHASVAVSGIASTPLRMRHVEKRLESHGTTADLRGAYAQDLGERPGADGHDANLRYAESLVAVLLDDAVQAL
jgi:carbon-monoxide dehydrogenase medium subunit